MGSRFHQTFASVEAALDRTPHATGETFSTGKMKLFIVGDKAS
jgi:hypothetical protein